MFYAKSFVLFMTIMVVPGVHNMASLVKVSSKGVDPSLKFVATVDGKSYFAEDTSQRTWSEASEFCQAMSMQLATIETSRQFAALKAAYSTDFVLSHWTSARDSMKPRQFSWDETDKEVSSDFEFHRDHGISFQTCLAFHSSADSHLYPDLCSSKSGTLCETFGVKFKA